jgi:hypothetical protein
MTLILSGTDGLSDIDGSAATPAVRGTDTNTGIFFGADIIGFAEGGAEVARFNADAQFVAAAGTASLPVITTTGDTNTGIFFPTADTIAFAEGGAEAMRIDSSGNVGIGTASPSSFYSEARNLVVGTGTGGQGMTIYAGTASQSRIMFADGTTGSDPYTGFVQYDHSSNALNFGTNGGTERARITSDGEFCINTTGIGSTKLRVYQNGNSNDNGYSGIDILKGSNNTTTAQVFQRFFTDAGNVGNGSITANGVAAATFTAYSDRRLKENIQDLPAQLDNICRLKPSEFDYIGYPEEHGHQIGFIAQDMQEVYPDVVAADKEGMLQIAGWSKTEARLVKAIQEQQALITALTARITALEAQNANNPSQGETP